MEQLSKIMLYESHLRELEREAENIQLGAQLPGSDRPAPWRALLVTAVLLIGMIAWLIH
jgi:hypothetical protein